MNCYLLGEKLGHSFSAEIHGRLGLYQYDLKPLSPKDFSLFMENKEFDGLNITIPYKRDVMKYLDHISPEAKACGAVNTVVNRGGKLLGFNTDFLGLSHLFSHFAISVEGKKALILGSGGTSGTAFQVLESLGAKEILRVSRSEKEGFVTYAEAEEKHRDAEILVNTTPCGMYPNSDETPISLTLFPSLTAVVDVVYNPLKTRLVLEAEKRGIPSFGGLFMLVSQAVYAAEIFTEKEGLLSQIPSIYEEIKRGKENLVLTGMPGSGKSILGKILSEKLGKGFVDTDEEIKREAGMEISEIFASFGEEDFRRREREVITRLSKENSLVIATGGGVPTFPENVENLKKNGRILFLDASPETLVATPDRPLSQTREALYSLYEKRYGIYLSTADVTISVTRDKNENIEKILKVL